ncbi:MAG: small multi-drug export protein [Desulfobacteraceae bacterium]|nr:small multi-drug export protein [Desulfobacteraceae bacterium]
MNEMIQFLKNHLAEHYAAYFFILYIVGGRPGAVLSAMAVDISVYWVVPAVVIMDTFQIPLFNYLYGAVSKQKIIQKLMRRSQKRMVSIKRSGFIKTLTCLGPPGVMIIAMLPLKGCGMWSGVLISRLIKLPLIKSYTLLICGSFLGCLLLAGAGEGLIRLLTF